VSNRVAERLRAAGCRVKHLRAEGKFASSVTEAIRDLGRDAKNLALVPEAEFLLYVARDVQLVEEALRPALADHDVVIADRFFYTAEVLAEHGRNLSSDFTRPVLDVVSRGLVPDLVVLVDVDPKLARARRKSAKLVMADARPPSRKGLAGVGLQHRLRRGYLERARREPERWAVLDNAEALDAGIARVEELIETARRSGVAAGLAGFGNSVANEAPSSVLASPSDALAALLEWVDRRMVREPRVAAYLMGGLHGFGVDERRRALAERAPEGVLAALSGLDDPMSWEIRALLEGRKPAAVVRSLGALGNENRNAEAIRAAHLDDAPEALLASIDALDDPFSWRIRDACYDRYPAAVVATLREIDSDRAWDVRARWLERTSGDMETYETARVAARSVTCLDGDRAWRVRELARQAAPVSVITSLRGLRSDRAWELREQYLKRAPKPVMASLRDLTDERSWPMRRAVAAECKEAIDSLGGLDVREAWDLREAHTDTWPSTVVKSLGPLADLPRGRALVERQLAAYPSDLSLLQHCAAIALGAHHAEPSDD
jgi:dTMP kinase